MVIGMLGNAKSNKENGSRATASESLATSFWIPPQTKRASKASPAWFTGGAGSCLMRVLYVTLLITAVVIFCMNLLAGYRIQMEIQQYSPRGESLRRVYSLELRQQPQAGTLRNATDSQNEGEGEAGQDNAGSRPTSSSSSSDAAGSGTTSSLANGNKIKHADGSETKLTPEKQQQQDVGASSPDQKKAKAANQHVPVPETQRKQEQQRQDPEAYPAVDQNGKKIFPPKDEEFIGPARSKSQPVGDDSSLRNYMPRGPIPDPKSAEYQQNCAEHHPPGQHAIFTMASGDRAARMATAVLQSLRDVNTCQSIELNIMISGGGIGSEDCMNKVVPSELRSQCGSFNLTDPRGSISQIFLNTWEQMNVKVRLVRPIAVDSEYLNMPGGRKIAWGMAFNKLNVFGFTQYKKVSPDVAPHNINPSEADEKFRADFMDGLRHSRAEELGPLTLVPRIYCCIHK
eukprot:gb/GECG01007262.1/.p1 GENE.gb/GECG01007262.1/~~gb/GECG01007262.1/.p1  ORF type:complete len:457 (+),score=65.19 gb/GECG01007262.1/:1-1371(+)